MSALRSTILALVLVPAGALAQAPAPGPIMPEPGPAGSEPVVSPVVRMTDDERFEPAEIQVHVGALVTWENGSTLPHSVTTDRNAVADPSDVEVPESPEAFDSGTVQPQQSFTHRFDVPGTYRYVCTFHEADGMSGTIVVLP